MEVKFDGMYINNLANKHDERDELKNRKIEAYKKGISLNTRDYENSNGSDGSVKCFTLSSQM